MLRPVVSLLSSEHINVGRRPSPYQSSQLLVPCAVPSVPTSAVEAARPRPRPPVAAARPLRRVVRPTSAVTAARPLRRVVCPSSAVAAARPPSRCSSPASCSMSPRRPSQLPVPCVVSSVPTSPVAAARPLRRVVCPHVGRHSCPSPASCIMSPRQPSRCPSSCIMQSVPTSAITGSSPVTLPVPCVMQYVPTSAVTLPVILHHAVCHHVGCHRPVPRHSARHTASCRLLRGCLASYPRVVGGVKAAPRRLELLVLVDVDHRVVMDDPLLHRVPDHRVDEVAVVQAAVELRR